jgi:hypothetical protein
MTSRDAGLCRRGAGRTEQRASGLVDGLGSAVAPQPEQSVDHRGVNAAAGGEHVYAAQVADGLSHGGVEHTAPIG